MRYLIFVVTTALFVVFGFPQCKSALSEYEQVKELSAQNTELATKLDSAKTERDSVAQQLREKDIDVADSNLEIAQTVSMLASASIVDIAGEYYDGTAFQSVVDVTEVADVEFFTSDVQYMNFFLHSTDIEQTLDSIQHMNLCVSGVDVDYESGSVYLRIPTIFISGTEEESDE